VFACILALSRITRSGSCKTDCSFLRWFCHSAAGTPRSTAVHRSAPLIISFWIEVPPLLPSSMRHHPAASCHFPLSLTFLVVSPCYRTLLLTPPTIGASSSPLRTVVPPSSATSPPPRVHGESLAVKPCPVEISHPCGALPPRRTPPHHSARRRWSRHRACRARGDRLGSMPRRAPFARPAGMTCAAGAGPVGQSLGRKAGPALFLCFYPFSVFFSNYKFLVIPLRLKKL
jgi:hypothetical protein